MSFSFQGNHACNNQKRTAFACCGELLLDFKNAKPVAFFSLQLTLPRIPLSGNISINEYSGKMQSMLKAIYQTKFVFRRRYI